MLLWHQHLGTLPILSFSLSLFLLFKYILYYLQFLFRTWFYATQTGGFSTLYTLFVRGFLAMVFPHFRKTMVFHTVI